MSKNTGAVISNEMKTYLWQKSPKSNMFNVRTCTVTVNDRELLFFCEKLAKCHK